MTALPVQPHSCTMVSYNQIATHRWMIRDSARNEAFRNALLSSVAPGAVVLDAGAGTGILSLFAAQAGAGRVYAVENTAIANVAAGLVERNGLNQVVQVIRADVARAPVPERVDIIVSEWLGSIGVNENLLVPVLLARDRWLKPGGTMIPAVVAACAAPAELSMRPDAAWFRDRTYGLDLSPLAEPSIHEQLCHLRRVVPGELAAAPVELWRHDIRTMPVDDARLPARAEIAFEFPEPKRVNAVVAWFVAELAAGCTLSNSPDSPETHWGQLMLPLNRTIECKRGDKLMLRLVCIPTWPGQSEMAWSVRIGDGPWEHHDTRTSGAGQTPSLVRGARRPVFMNARRPEAQAGQNGALRPAQPSAGRTAAPITVFLARLAMDPNLLREFLRHPDEVLKAHKVPPEDQCALLSRSARAIEAAMFRT